MDSNSKATDMTDKEMLERAAAALGHHDTHYEDGEWLDLRYGVEYAMWSRTMDEATGCGYWNPICLDGQAFRLQVDLKMRTQVWESTCEASAHWGDFNVFVPVGEDPSAALRLAIVRLAAQMPSRPTPA